jgi:hypothetical protein
VPEVYPSGAEGASKIHLPIRSFFTLFVCAEANDKLNAKNRRNKTALFIIYRIKNLQYGLCFFND